MKKKNNNLKDTDFVQLSTRLRASLGSFSHTDRVQKAIDGATSPSALASALRSILMQDVSVPESAGLDGMCDAYLAYTVETVQANSPVLGLYDSLLLKFDAANLKLAIKAALRGEGEPELFPYGTLGSDVVLRAARENDFTSLPAGLREGCESAVASYNASADAMSVDLAIDRGCFADMSEAAKKSGDIAIPLGRGEIASDSENFIGDIGGVLAASLAGRTSAEDITMFKSIGISAVDVAAALVIYEKAAAQGLGVEVEI